MNSNRAFTLIELLVVITIISILAGFSLGPIQVALARAQMTDTLNNAKQIHMATMHAALESQTSSDASVGWPGDAHITTVPEFAKMLVDNQYLEESDLKLFRAPGFPAITKKEQATADAIAFKVYGICSSHNNNTIFLITKNHPGTYTKQLAGNPYGNKGFVCCHKDGSVAIYREQQADKPDVIGAFQGDPLQ